jgi:sec-independent protein translocase protein TatA
MLVPVPVKERKAGWIMNFGTTEMLVVLAIVVLLFGAKRIPDLMRGFGEGIKSFKEGMRDSPSNGSSSAPAPPVDAPHQAAEKK